MPLTNVSAVSYGPPDAGFSAVLSEKVFKQPADGRQFSTEEVQYSWVPCKTSIR